MNRTLLLILCDFLLLNLLALTRWEKAEPARATRPPVPELNANAQTPDQDLVAAMKQSLTDEQASRAQVAQKLSAAENNLGAIETERNRLSTSLAETQRAAAETQRTATEFSQKAAAAAQEAAMTKEQLARIQRELEDKRAETDRQQKALSELELQQAAARQRIEGLTVAVKVAEQEKVMLQQSADTFKQQAAAERKERETVQATTVQLAQGVGQLAQKSGELTQEIRDNRPINANVLFSNFLASRVHATFTAGRPSLLGAINREKSVDTILVKSGSQVYALLHLADTPFSFLETGTDWSRIGIEFSKPPDYKTKASEFRFLSLDPRIIAVPVDAFQVLSLGGKVYETALDPVRFPDAVLIDGGGKGYGEVGFKLDASQPGYVRVDNRFFKRLFGDFAPTRGDIVVSKSGELLGIMVNSDYCAVINNFLPSQTIKTGDDLKGQGISGIFDDLVARYRALPFKLQ